MKFRNTYLASVLFTVMGASASFGAAAADAEAAKTLARDNDCLQCHSVDKTKKGPSYQKIAAKYKGQANAEEKITKHLTTGPRVKLEDGSEEDHKIIKTKDTAQIKNLVDWILGQ